MGFLTATGPKRLNRPEEEKMMERQLYCSPRINGKIESLDDEVDSLRKAFVRLFQTLFEENQLKVLGGGYEKEPE